MRVLIVDDNRLLSDALRVLLDAEDDIEVVGAAASAEEALEVWADEEIDVVVMDVDLPGIDGIEATRRMREIRQGARVVVISSPRDTGVIARAIEAGGSGYVSKSHAAEELVSVIRRVAAGEIVIPVDELMQTLSRLQKLRSAHSEVGRLIEQLTGREVEVVTLMAEGLSTEDISRRLQIRPATTRAHIRSVLGKLMVHSRLQAVGLALREGFIRTRDR